MARERPYLHTLNAGEISPLALGRVDLSRMRLACETYLNWLPRVIGPARFRPGMGYLNSTRSNAVARNLPFVFEASDTALIELTDSHMRVRVDDAVVSLSPGVSTVITNGSFSSGTGWTITTTGGGEANINSTFAGMLAMRTLVRGSTVIVKRSVSVSVTDQSRVHHCRIVVDRGPVKFRIGSSDGGDDVLNETELDTGQFSLVFTPGAATIWVQFSVESEAWRVVDSCTIETGTGDLDLPAPWAAADLFLLSADQSGDVIFVANRTYQPRKIERRGNPAAWGIAKYEFRDGPWMGKTANVALTPTVRIGNGVMTSNLPFFKSTHLGAIFSLYHPSTTVSHSLAAADRYTDPVRVSGVRRYDLDNDGDTDRTTERDITVTVSGTFTGTLSLLISYDEGASYTQIETIASGASITRTVGSDNAVTLVRAGFLPGNYTSGTAVVTITYTGGGGTGQVRVVGFNSSTSVNIEVIERLHQAATTEEWEEGRFSDFRGWPSSVSLFEGRLWFAGNDKIVSSVSDDFDSFDLEPEGLEGDAASIQRSVATGPVNRVVSMLALSRLCLFTTGSEPVARSSSFDEPLTPTNFSLKDASTLGSANVQAIKIDKSGIFIQRSGSRAYIIRYSVEANDYESDDITKYHEDVLSSGVKVMAIQRQPDTRVWFVLNNGTAVGLVYEPKEEVISFFRVTTDGTIEDVSILPNDSQDDVYFIVSRTGTATVRNVEKLAYDSAAIGGTANQIGDSFKAVTIPANKVITGLTHLAGMDNVVIWAGSSPVLDADGDPVLYTVSAGGQITATEAPAGAAVVGLYYEGDIKTSKLAYGAQMGTALSQPKKVSNVAPILYKTHINALRFGVNFDSMEALPRMIGGVDRGADYFLDSYDARPIDPPSGFDTDSRVCVRARAPMPATILALSMVVETNER